MVYSTTANGDIGVFMDQSATHSVAMTAAATIHITHLGTAKISLVVTNSDRCYAYRTTAYRYICTSCCSGSFSRGSAFSHTGHLSTAIDAGLHRTILHVNLCVLLDKTSIKLGILIINFILQKATITAAKDTAEGVLRVIATVFYLSTDSCTSALNDDFSTCIDILVSSVFGGMVSHYLSQLATTIDTTLNGTACDGQLGTLDTTQLPPVYRRDSCRTIQLIKSTHTTCEHVTALGMLQSIVRVIFCIRYIRRFIGVIRIKLIFPLVTNSTTADGNVDMSTSMREESCSTISKTFFDVIIITHLSIARCRTATSRRIK